MMRIMKGKKIPPSFLIKAFSQVYLEELGKFDMPTLVKLAEPLVPDLKYKIVSRALVLQLHERFDPMLAEFDKAKQRSKS